MISRFFAAAFITALLPVAVPSPSQAPAGHSAVELRFDRLTLPETPGERERSAGLRETP